jgi:hypothetical protein
MQVLLYRPPNRSTPRAALRRTMTNLRQLIAVLPDARRPMRTVCYRALT